MTNQDHAARSVEALATHGDFVRALARRLVSDPNEAEDIAQQTQLAALKGGPRDPDAARSWLATITRNVARQNARGAASRRLRETTVARPVTVPSTADIAEREAMRRSVVEAVLALPEHYRAVILLRFYEDLPVREVASRLELPRETVRTRVKRGLAQLRAALDREHGDRETWRRAVTPLAALPGASATTVSVAWWVAAAVVLLLGGASLLVWWPQPIVPDPGARAVAGRSEARSAKAPLAASTPDAGPSAPAASTPIVSGRVQFADGRSAAGHRLVLLSVPVAAIRRDALPAAPVERIECDGNGRFAIATLRDGVHWLVSPIADGQGYVVHARLACGVTPDDQRRTDPLHEGLGAGNDLPSHDCATPLALELESVPGFTVTGRIVDSAGRPVRDATVLIAPAPERMPSYDAWLNLLGPLVQRVSVDAGGHFRVSGCGEALSVLARSPSHLAVGESLRGVADRSDVVVRLHPIAWPQLAGRVVDEHDVPQQRVQLRLREVSGDALAPARETAASVATDNAGRFRIRDDLFACVGTWVTGDHGTGTVQVIASAPGFVAACSTPLSFTNATAAARSETMLRLYRPTILVGRVLAGARRTAIAGATVRLQVDATSWAAVTDAAGRFEFPGVARARGALTIQLDGFETVRRDIDTTQTASVDITLTRLAWDVQATVVTEDGERLERDSATLHGDQRFFVVPRVQVYAVDPRGAVVPPIASRDEDPTPGAFRFGLPASYTADRAWVAFRIIGRAPVVHEIRRGDAPLLFRIDRGADPKLAWLAVRVEGPDGKPIANASPRLRRSDGIHAHDASFTRSRGVRFIAERGAHYALTVRAPGFGSTSIEDIRIADEGDVPLVVARLAREASIRVIAQLPPNADTIASRTKYSDQKGRVLGRLDVFRDERRVDSVVIREAAPTIRGLSAGTYRIRMTARGFAGTATCTIVAGQRAQLPIALEVATKTVITAADRLGPIARISVFDRRGAEVASASFRYGEARTVNGVRQPPAMTVRLPSGRYRVVASPFHGAPITRSLIVPVVTKPHRIAMVVGENR